MNAMSENVKITLAMVGFAVSGAFILFILWSLGSGFFLKFSGLFIGFAIAHLGYQYFTDKDYSKAFEILWWQFGAVIAAYILC